MGKRSRLYAAMNGFGEELDTFGGLLLTLRGPKEITPYSFHRCPTFRLTPVLRSLLATSVPFHMP